MCKCTLILYIETNLMITIILFRYNLVANSDTYHNFITTNMIEVFVNDYDYTCCHS